MTSWSTDISAASRGKRVTVRKIGKDGKVNASTRMEREPVWLASDCGKVILSEWHWPQKIGEYGTAMTKARWSMFCAGAVPLAWRPYVEGEFPRIVTKVKGSSDLVEYPNGKGPEFPAMILGVAA